MVASGKVSIGFTNITGTTACTMKTLPLATVNILPPTKHSHIFKHLRGSENSRSLCSEDCFKIFDSASTSFPIENQRSHAHPLGAAVNKFPSQTSYFIPFTLISLSC